MAFKLPAIVQSHRYRREWIYLEYDVTNVPGLPGLLMSFDLLPLGRAVLAAAMRRQSSGPISLPAIISADRYHRFFR